MGRAKLQRKLAAIVFTDIVNFSGIMHRDEGEALEVLDTQRMIFAPVLDEYGGTILKEMGDGLLIEFTSSVNAVQCALEMQGAIDSSNATDAPRFQVRVGIHLGDVVVSGNDILGDGVNVAARLEPLATPGGICMTEVVYQSVKSSVSADFRRTADVALKNVEERFTLYEIPGRVANSQADASEPDFQPRVRIEIQSVDEDTRVLSSLAALWPAYVFVPGFAFLVMRGNFLEWAVVSAISVVGIAYLVYHRSVRIAFADVRQVMTLLDVLLVRMGYGLVDTRERELTYVHGPAPWKERKGFAWVRWADSMVVTFDGNTVYLKGPNIHIRRMLSGMRKLSGS